jgi:ecdysteroid kinase
MPHDATDERGVGPADDWRPDITDLVRYGPYGRAAPMPMRHQDVTASAVTQLLEHRYPGIGIRSMTTVELRNTHTTKLRVAVEWNDVGHAAHLPASLCLKGNFTGRANPLDICEIEARFYHQMVADTALPVPRCWYSDWDGDGSGQGLVVLEDLIELGGEFGNTYQHIGVEAVAAALTELAALHGAFWASPVLSVPWLPTSMDTRGDSEQARLMWWLVEENIERDVYIQRLPEWMVADRRRFLRAYDLLNDYARAQTGPITIVHGDAYLGNTYLKPDGRRIWLDWQMVRKGHPWRDVSYFMLTALTVEERRERERDLLRHYRSELVGTGAQDVPDDEAIWQQYRRWAMYGLQSWMGTKDHWGQDNHSMIERFAVATDDLGTLALLEAQIGAHAGRHRTWS